MTWRAVEMGGARIISLVRFLILAKLLAPDDFGLLAIAAITIDLLLSLTDLGMMPSLVQRREPEQRHYDAAWTVEVLRAAGVTAVLLVGAPAIAELFNEQRATPIIRSLAVAAFIASLGSARIVDLTRTLQFRPLAKMELASATVEAVVSIALARTLGVWALVAGQMSASVVRTATTWMLAPYRPRLTLEPEAVRPLLAFGRWVLVTVIAYVAGDAVLRWVVSRRLGTEDVGLYYVAFRLAMLPKVVASDIVRPVAFPIYARLQNAPAEAARIFRSTILGTAGILLPSYAVLIALTPPLVASVLGVRWVGSAVPIRILALAACISLVTECTIPLVQGLGRPHFGALIFGVRSALVALLVWWLTGAYGIAGAAFAWLLAEVAVQVLAAGAARRTHESAALALGTPLAAITVAAVGGGLIAWLVYDSLGGLLGLALAIGVAGFLSFGLLALLDRYFGLGLLAGITLLFPRLGRLLPTSPRESDV